MKSLLAPAESVEVTVRIRFLANVSDLLNASEESEFLM